MTPCNKIKREILLEADEHNEDLRFGIPLDSDSNVEKAYDLLEQADANCDFESEFRASGEETGLPCDYSRHYESKAVARKLSDGSWVGWTYWYGGGKHGEPGAIEWMEGAYDVTCKEEEKLVVVRTFSLKKAKNGGSRGR